MAQMLGTYKLERNENLDEFYRVAGVPWIARKLMLSSSPTMIVSTEKDEGDEDTFLIKTISFIRTMEQSFKIGEPYEETMPSGDTFECLSEKLGDNKLVIKGKCEDKGELIREYEFNSDGAVITLKFGDVEAKRYFKRE
jgi:hypothetical protein